MIELMSLWYRVEASNVVVALIPFAPTRRGIWSPYRDSLLFLDVCMVTRPLKFMLRSSLTAGLLRSALLAATITPFTIVGGVNTTAAGSLARYAPVGSWF